MLIISGLLLVLDAAVTLVWREPVTAVIATIIAGHRKTYWRRFVTSTR